MQFASPPNSSALPAAVIWVEQLLLGSMANVIAILGVAGVGALMLTGRLAWRSGARVIVGCFLVFGASTIANGLVGFQKENADRSAPTLVPLGREEAQEVTEFDPYAGASPMQQPSVRREMSQPPPAGAETRSLQPPINRINK